MRNFYISTPIYYVNEKPHIGHVYTTTLADVIARSHRLDGEEVFFLTGTDEHAAKVVEAAVDNGLSTREWADRNAEAFRVTFSEFGISNDDFIRTSEKRHVDFVKRVISDLVKSGDVYLGKYEGWYDVSQEEYVAETRAKEFDFRSPVTGKALVRRTEENYFFRLSSYADQLLQRLRESPETVQPEARRNEVISRIEEGLSDVPISRTGGGEWGVPFPGNSSHMIYVWIDALLNYTSAIDVSKRRHYWPANVHLIAKDILWFHAVIWPAMLLALQRTQGNEWLGLPDTVYAHSFWISEGQKMSKSLGNFVDLGQLRGYRERFGLDALRYYLATQGPIDTTDSDFALSRFIDVYNSDLANTVGNAWSRIVSMTDRYLNGRLPARAEPGSLGIQVKDILAQPLDSPLGLDNVKRGLEIVRAIDGYIQKTQPFRLAKQAAKERKVAEILYQCAEAYRIASLRLWPVLTSKMPVVWEQSGCGHYADTLTGSGTGTLGRWSDWGGLPEGTSLVKSDVLYPRYEKE